MKRLTRPIRVGRNVEEGIVFQKSVTDWIKLLACMMVMIHHYSQYAISNHFSTNIILRLFDTQGGFLGVALFFFLSGYGLMQSERTKHLSFGVYLVRRLMRVYLPVIVITAIWLAIRCMCLNQCYVSVFDFLWGFGDSVLWFVQVILILYLVFYLYVTARSMLQSLCVRMFSLLVVTILATTIVYCNFEHFMAVSVPLFFIGVALSEYHVAVCRLFRRRAWLGIVVVLLLLVGLMASIRWRLCLWLPHAMFNYLFIACCLFVASYVSLSVEKQYSFVWLGDYAFAIYLTHMKVLALLRETIDGYVPFVAFLLFALVTALVGMMIIRTVNKLPRCLGYRGSNVDRK